MRPESSGRFHIKVQTVFKCTHYTSIVKTLHVLRTLAHKHTLFNTKNTHILLIIIVCVIILILKITCNFVH